MKIYLFILTRNLLAGIFMCHSFKVRVIRTSIHTVEGFTNLEENLVLVRPFATFTRCLQN